MLNCYAAIEIDPVICEEDRPGITMLSETSWIIERPTHGLAHVESGKKSIKTDLGTCIQANLIEQLLKWGSSSRWLWFLSCWQKHASLLPLAHVDICTCMCVCGK